MCCTTTMPSGVASVEDILGSLYAKPTARSFVHRGCCKTLFLMRNVRELFWCSPAAHSLQRLSDNSLSLLVYTPPTPPPDTLFPPIHNILMRNGAGDNNAVTCRKAWQHRGGRTPQNVTKLLYSHKSRQMVRESPPHNVRDPVVLSPNDGVDIIFSAHDHVRTVLAPFDTQLFTSWMLFLHKSPKCGFQVPLQLWVSLR